MSDKAKKAIKVLRGGCTNNIILNDMYGVLEREFLHLENSLDMASEHVESLTAERDELADEKKKWIDSTNTIIRSYESIAKDDDAERDKLREAVCIADDYLEQHWDMESAPLHKIRALAEKILAKGNDSGES